jgi:hypothetical protein
MQIQGATQKKHKSGRQPTNDKSGWYHIHLSVPVLDYREKKELSRATNRNKRGRLPAAAHNPHRCNGEKVGWARAGVQLAILVKGPFSRTILFELLRAFPAIAASARAHAVRLALSVLRPLGGSCAGRLFDSVGTGSVLWVAAGPTRNVVGLCAIDISALGASSPHSRAIGLDALRALPIDAASTTDHVCGVDGVLVLLVPGSGS